MQSDSYQLSIKEYKEMFHNSFDLYQQEALSYLKEKNVSLNANNEKKIISLFARLFIIKDAFFIKEDILSNALKYIHDEKKLFSFFKNTIKGIKTHQEKEETTIKNGVQQRRENKTKFPAILNNGDIYLRIKPIETLNHEINQEIERLNTLLPLTEKLSILETSEKNLTKYFVQNTKKNKKQTLGRFLFQQEEQLSSFNAILQQCGKREWIKFINELQSHKNLYNIDTSTNPPKKVNWFNKFKKEYPIFSNTHIDETLFHILKNELSKDTSLKTGLKKIQSLRTRVQTLKNALSFMQTKEQSSSEKKEALFVDTLVFSIKPRSIARMSSYVNWENESCMSPNGSHYHYVTEDIANGSIVVYGINSQRPHYKICRALLKPYNSENGEIIYGIGKTYGQLSTGFTSAISDWVNQNINKPKDRTFYIHPKLYQDTAPHVIHYATTPAEVYQFQHIDYKEFQKNNKKYYTIKKPFQINGSFSDIDYSTSVFKNFFSVIGQKIPEKLPLFAQNLYLNNVDVNKPYNFSRTEKLSLDHCAIKNLSTMQLPTTISISGSVVKDDKKTLHFTGDELCIYRSNLNHLHSIKSNTQKFVLDGSTIDNLSELDLSETKSAELLFSKNPAIILKAKKLKLLQLPKEDLSICNLQLPSTKNLKLSELKTVKFNRVDLSLISRIIGPEKKFYLNASNVKNVKEISLKNLKESLYLNAINLSHLEKITFPEKANFVYIQNTRLPEISLIDLSEIKEVNLILSDLKNVKNIIPSSEKFILKESVLSPEIKTLNFEKTKELFISKMDLSHVKEITFSKDTTLENTIFNPQSKFNFSKTGRLCLKDIKFELNENCLNQKRLELIDVNKLETSSVLDLSRLKYAKIQNSSFKDVRKIIAPEIFEIDGAIFPSLIEIDFSNTKKIIFKNVNIKDTKINLHKVKNVDFIDCQLPTNIDFSSCQKVNLKGSKFTSLSSTPSQTFNLSKIKFNHQKTLNLSNCKEVILDNADLREVHQIIPPKERLYMTSAMLSPHMKTLDLKNLKSAVLEATHLNHLSQFFPPKELLTLDGAMLPEHLDLSGVNIASLKKCDLSKTNTFIPSKKYIDLSESILPEKEEIDLSSCQKVNLYFTRVPSKKLILHSKNNSLIKKALIGSTAIIYKEKSLSEKVKNFLSNKLFSHER